METPNFVAESSARMQDQAPVVSEYGVSRDLEDASSTFSGRFKVGQNGKNVTKHQDTYRERGTKGAVLSGKTMENHRKTINKWWFTFK